MKLLILTIVLTCNQVVYDQIYYSVVANTLKTKVSKKDMDIRNNTIEMLRKLCNGQRSSYERDTDVK